MNIPLDFSGKTQLYFQIYDILKKKINNNEYTVGKLMPTELELSEMFNVSRITIRKAMDLLVSDKLIARRRGYGTIILPPKVEQPINKVIHFSEETEKQGHKSTTIVLANELIPATEEIAKALNVPPGTLLIHINRLRIADETPMCIESAYFIYSMCPSIYGVDYSKISLRNTLKEKHGITWDNAIQKIFAINANSSISSHLDIKPNDPILYVERVSYTPQNIAGEYLRIYYRGDSYFFFTKLDAKN